MRTKIANCVSLAILGLCTVAILWHWGRPFEVFLLTGFGLGLTGRGFGEWYGWICTKLGRAGSANVTDAPRLMLINWVGAVFSVIGIIGFLLPP